MLGNGLAPNALYRLCPFPILGDEDGVVRIQAARLIAGELVVRLPGEETDVPDADLSRADLRGADLRGANLDFSCWPLWCGSLKAKTDARQAAQLAYHLCSMQCDDEEYIKMRNSILEFANKFHRVGECGTLTPR